MNILFKWIKSVLAGRPQDTPAKAAPLADTCSEQEMFPYDESLLERSRIQWQFGDWASLASIDREQIQHHPDRSKLALLAAAGHMGSGDIREARQYAQLAMDWGGSRQLVAQVLVSGVYNTLACAASVHGDQAKALEHFRSAVMIGMPNGDKRLLAQARMDEQSRQLGLAPRLETESTWLSASDVGFEHKA